MDVEKKNLWEMDWLISFPALCLSHSSSSKWHKHEDRGGWCDKIWLVITVIKMSLPQNPLTRENHASALVQKIFCLLQTHNQQHSVEWLKPADLQQCSQDSNLILWSNWPLIASLGMQSKIAFDGWQSNDCEPSHKWNVTSRHLIAKTEILQSQR